MPEDFSEQEAQQSKMCIPQSDTSLKTVDKSTTPKSLNLLAEATLITQPATDNKKVGAESISKLSDETPVEEEER